MDPISLLLLAMVLSVDSLMVGLLYGARRIKLSWTAILVVSAATGLLLLIAMSMGQAVAAVLPAALAEQIGALLLAGVGLWITYQTWRGHQYGRMTLANTPNVARKVWHLRLGSVGIVVEILLDSAAADIDRSGHINFTEACLLGIALALDSVAAGLGASMAGYSPYGLPAAAAAGSCLFMAMGSRTAHLVKMKYSSRWTMLHGPILVALGLYRMMM